jgi:hypothetical protein
MLTTGRQIRKQLATAGGLAAGRQVVLATGRQKGKRLTGRLIIV